MPEAWKERDKLNYNNSSLNEFLKKELPQDYQTVAYYLNDILNLEPNQYKIYQQIDERIGTMMDNKNLDVKPDETNIKFILNLAFKWNQLAFSNDGNFVAISVKAWEENEYISIVKHDQSSLQEFLKKVKIT